MKRHHPAVKSRHRTVTLASLGLAVLGACLLSQPVSAFASGYVFSTFLGDATTAEKLSIYTSPDALNFTRLSDTGFGGPSGNLRDPSIMKHTDGKYYVTYTDPIGAGCCGQVNHFSVASSSDLIHWTNVTLVPAGVAGVAHAWAPEWFVDGSTISIIANIDTRNNDTDFKPYVFTAQDSALTTWSAPVPLGFGPNYIDTFVLKSAGTYHAFTKNESTRYLEHATAPALTGPWTFVGTGNWSGFGPGMEGPSIVQLDDGTWRIYVDSQFRPQTTRLLTATSPDLKTWSAPIPLPGAGFLRHGTVIRDARTVPSDGGGGADANAGGIDATATDSGSTAMMVADAGADDAPSQDQTPPLSRNDEAGADGGAPVHPVPPTGDASVDARLPVPFADAALPNGAAPSDNGGCSCRVDDGRHAFFPGFAAFALVSLACFRSRKERALRRGSRTF